MRQCQLRLAGKQPRMRKAKAESRKERETLGLAGEPRESMLPASQRLDLGLVQRAEIARG